MKDKLIFRNNIVKLITIGIVMFLLEEALLLFLYFNFEFANNDALLYAMAILATALPCMAFLLFSEYLKLNEHTVSLYKLTKKKIELNLADVTITVEYKTVNARTGAANEINVKNISNNVTRQYIVLKDTNQQEITFLYDEKTYNLLNEYISLAKR